MSSTLNSFMDGRKNTKGFMIAEVADNLDTEKAYADEGKMIGRLKLSIPGISDEIDKEDLPWAYQMSQTGSGTHDGVGAFRVPAIGTKVICMKIDDQYGWVVMGELNTTQHTTKDYEEDYPETWGMRDKTGNKSVINMKKEYAQFTHSSGTNAKVEKDGDTTIVVKKDMVTKVTGFGKENYGKTLDITSVQTMTLKAPTIILDGNVIVKGWVHASGDVTAGAISLMLHTHVVPMVMPGPTSPDTTKPTASATSSTSTSSTSTSTSSTSTDSDSSDDFYGPLTETESMPDYGDTSMSGDGEEGDIIEGWSDPDDISQPTP